jgi:hypothetical protein
VKIWLSDITAPAGNLVPTISALLIGSDIIAAEES